MCANCEKPMPEEAAKFMSMGLATVADEMERQSDMQVRLECLKLAIRVKGAVNPETHEPASSAKILSSAHAYYDFITNKKDASVK